LPSYYHGTQHNHPTHHHGHHNQYHARSSRRYFRSTTTSKHTETESTVTSARCFPPSTVRGQCPLGWLTTRDNSCVAFLMTPSFLEGYKDCSKKGGKLFSIGEKERPCVADLLNNSSYVWLSRGRYSCRHQDLSSGLLDWETCKTQHHYPCEVSLPLPGAQVEQMTVSNRNRTKADVTKGDPLNLRCTYGGVALSPVRIIREDLNLILASSSSNSSNSFTFSKDRAECEDQGWYRCQAGSAAPGKRLELGVRGCFPLTTTALNITTPPTTTATTTSTTLRSARSSRRYFRSTTTSKHTETESTVTSARCLPPSTVRGQCPLGWLTTRDNSCVAFLMTPSYLEGHKDCSKKGGKLFSIGEKERPCVAGEYFPFDVGH
ncbi:uncharacterized protein LOC101849991, partial [Aplysia californica]|uniref:Uncharacterized protein LOC101849991 n=1 Tax=Aplysia californica TaxID=6500 RepID=A0ABM0KBA6_APLCA